MTIKNPLKRDLEKKFIQFNPTTNLFEVVVGEGSNCDTTLDELKLINDYREFNVILRAAVEGRPEDEIRKEEAEKMSTQLKSDWKFEPTGKLSKKMDEAEQHMAVDDQKLRNKAIRQLLSYVKHYNKHKQFFFKLFKRLEY